MKRSEHKSRGGICADPAWTRHFPARFAIAGGEHPPFAMPHQRTVCAAGFQHPGVADSNSLRNELGYSTAAGQRLLLEVSGEMENLSSHTGGGSGNSCWNERDSVTATRGFYVSVLPQEGG